MPHNQKVAGSNPAVAAGLISISFVPIFLDCFRLEKVGTA